ncbi:MAG: serine hydrolase, partial [Gammaproteobacteria bacterium]|nr:serine hydrolase [Gammaproteobacteria bacterium]
MTPIIHRNRLLNSFVGSLLVALTAVVASPAWSQVYQLPGGAAAYDDPAIAAGFRALFTCSAHFVMHRPLADILEVELADTRTLELPIPVIDESRRLVRAADGRGYTSIAAYRDTMGCTVVPPHWQEADVPRLPYVNRELPVHDPSIDFPLGDRVTTQLDAAQTRVLDRAFDGHSYGENNLTVGIVIVRNGKVVAERYRPGFGVHQGYRTWSSAKSISATLVAIATGQGLMDLDAPVTIPEWQGPGDPRKAITPRDLLAMSSGLWSEGSNTNAMYFAGQDVISAATTTHLEAKPGVRWKYANNDTLLLLRALRHALADDLRYLRYPYDELFHRIGMYNTWMETDYLGNFIGSSQVYTTARDLARFGLLYLNDGIWNGERLLPEGWTSYVARPALS